MTIIKFMTKGCAPCAAVGEVLDGMGIEYEEVDLALDIDSAILHKVRSVPTLLNTETGERMIGFDGIYKTQEWVNDNCN